MGLVRCFQLAFSLRSMSLDQEGKWDTCDFLLRRTEWHRDFLSLWNQGWEWNHHSPTFCIPNKGMFFPIEWWQKWNYNFLNVQYLNLLNWELYFLTSFFTCLLKEAYHHLAGGPFYPWLRTCLYSLPGQAISLIWFPKSKHPWQLISTLNLLIWSPILRPYSSASV
jgi:hypothetical protein